MQSRLFHAVVAAGLSLGAASGVLAACSSPAEPARVDGDAGAVDATPADAADARAEAIADASSFDTSAFDAADASPERDAAIDADAGWHTTK